MRNLSPITAFFLLGSFNLLSAPQDRSNRSSDDANQAIALFERPIQNR